MCVSACSSGSQCSCSFLYLLILDPEGLQQIGLSVSEVVGIHIIIRYCYHVSDATLARQADRFVVFSISSFTSQSLNRLPSGWYVPPFTRPMRERRTILSGGRLPHSQHQVVHRRGGRDAVVLPSYYTQTTAINTIDHTSHRSGEGPDCSAYSSGSETSTRRVCTAAVSSSRRGGGQTMGDTTRRMQLEQWPYAVTYIHLIASVMHVAIFCQGRPTQSLEHFRGHHRQCFKYMHCLSRVASAASRLAVFVTLSVRDPRRDRSVDLYGRHHDLQTALFGEFAFAGVILEREAKCTAAMSSSVVAVTRLVL